MELKIKWEGFLHNAVKSNLSIFDNFERFFGPYYLSSYECPFCKKSLLYKIKTRGAYSFFNGKVIDIYNVFTCTHCWRIFGSPIDETGVGNLGKLAIVTGEYKSKKDYIDNLNEGIRHINDDY